MNFANNSYFIGCGKYNKNYIFTIVRDNTLKNIKKKKS